MMYSENQAQQLLCFRNMVFPAYQNDPTRSYGMPFGEKDIHFRVDGDILRVHDVTDFVKKQPETAADCEK